MRRLMLFLVIAPIAVMTVPAAAQTVVEPVACEAPPAGTTVIGPSHSVMPKVAAPMPPERPPPAAIAAPGGHTDVKYQLDLSPATAANVASVSAVLDWKIPINDWDLRLMDGAGAVISSSARRQRATPPAPATEWVWQTSMKHCSLFTVRVYNFLAIGSPEIEQIDPLRLEVETGIRR